MGVKGSSGGKGEKSSLVVFYKDYETDPTDEDDTGQGRVARASYFFNAAQGDGFEAPVESVPQLGPIEQIEKANRFSDYTRSSHPV